MTPLLPPTNGRLFIAAVDDELMDATADVPITANADGVGPMHEITSHITEIRFSDDQGEAK